MTWLECFRDCFITAVVVVGITGMFPATVAVHGAFAIQREADYHRGFRDGIVASKEDDDAQSLVDSSDGDAVLQP